MKKCIPGGSPIPMPDTISTPAEIGKFSDQVIRSLAALRDRPLHAPAQMQRGGGGSYVHPWKATSNGDDTIAVGDGKLIYFTGQTSGFSEPNSPYDGDYLEYFGTDIPITASGTLYLVISGTSNNDVPTSADTFTGLTILNMKPEYIDVFLDPTLSGHELSIPIAEVTLDTSGPTDIATVDKQILEHNPVMSVQWGQVN